ncbi:molybdopterin converting factor [Stratiformator vulcanicus]|uniref:Molybdopterin converting factor n=1 Tax=Stratiformator vulcanicus TaxID=2527980 RepID=A0A517QZ56_9PLAN|nr:molybdopterin converting factor [Stratiformator vulcanicus]QDT36888.1 hypothetical protein Pan189_12520 [Stratiformator vulcanicus]
MKIMLINNDGGGFADWVEVADGTTTSQLFARHIQFGSPKDYLIRVNRLPASSEQELTEGDRVSITPTKIEGAVHAA